MGNFPGFAPDVPMTKLFAFARPALSDDATCRPFRQVRGLAAAALLALSPLAQAGGTNVGVSVSVNQPGFYGRVDIGNTQPQVIYPQPVIIQQTPVAVVQRPIYLRVPPGHERNWAKHCYQYRACGQPVYFVRQEVRQERREDWRDDRRDDRHDDRHDGRREHGHGHGHGRHD
jgi:hypothetical protein